MATFTPNYGLRKPDDVDDVEVSTDLNANFDTIDTKLKLTDDKHQTSTSFPVAPLEGQTHYRSDQDKFYVYNGAAWLEMYPRAAYKARISDVGGTQNIPDGASTKVQFSSNNYNIGMTVDLTNESITVTQDGVYKLGCFVRWDVDNTHGGYRLIRIEVNGANVVGQTYNHTSPASLTSATDMNCSTELSLLTGDVITVTAYSTAGATVTISDRHLYVSEVQ